MVSTSKRTDLVFLLDADRLKTVTSLKMRTAFTHDQHSYLVLFTGDTELPSHPKLLEALPPLGLENLSAVIVPPNLPGIQKSTVPSSGQHDSFKKESWEKGKLGKVSMHGFSSGSGTLSAVS